MSENAVDVYYLSLPVDSTDQASSLASYLSNHGIEAAGEVDAVVCPVSCSGPNLSRSVLLIRQLHHSWRMFWQNSDAELYGLPVYRKPPSGCPQSCTT